MTSTRSPGPPPFQVDEASAHAVADEFQATPCQPGDPLVRAAFARLSEQADRWFAQITSLGREPVRVVFTDSRSPYADAVELSESVRVHRLLEVVSASHDHDRRHPLLDKAVGGPQDRLRAVHDIVSHGWQRYDFSRNGEFSAWLFEDTMYCGLARWALATELHAHHSVRWTSGELAAYKAALIDPRALTRSMTRARLVETG